MTVYGIKNCNTVKTAIAWLTKHNVEFEFHDYKSKGITEEKLKAWSRQVGWESLVNKKGTTWRQLDEAIQKKVINEATAINLMKDKNSIIKRPLIEQDGKVLALGFDDTVFSKTFI